MKDLPEPFLSALTAELAGDDVVALALTGSYVRGTATPFSDIDILRFAPVLPATERERYTLRAREDRLLSITTTTIAAKRAELCQPETAIFAAPGLRQM